MSIWKPSFVEAIMLGSYLEFGSNNGPSRFTFGHWHSTSAIAPSPPMQLPSEREGSFQNGYLRSDHGDLRHRPVPVTAETSSWSAEISSCSAETSSWCADKFTANEELVPKRRGRQCSFCRSLGEEVIDHRLKDEKGRVTCPILYAFKCKMCGSTGELAHTWKYCPLNPITYGDPIALRHPPGLPGHNRFNLASR